MEIEAIQRPFLAIDLGCQLFIQTSLVSERIPTSLIGIIPNSGLIIKTPPLQNVHDVFPVGDEIVLRYVYMGEVFGFKSKVIDCTVNPFKLIYVTYPDVVEKLCLRRNRRIICNFPANIHIEDHELRGMIVDISSIGALFTSRKTDNPDLELLQMDSEVKVHVPLLGESMSNCIHGRIRNIRRETGAFNAGIQFIHIDPDIEGKIEDYIVQVSENS